MLLRDGMRRRRSRSAIAVAPPLAGAGAGEGGGEVGVRARAEGGGGGRGCALQQPGEETSGGGPDLDLGVAQPRRGSLDENLHVLR